MRDNTIPVIIGVSGHRALRPGDVPVLYSAVKAELEKLQRLCPNTELMLLASLAEGADILCADAAEALGIPIIAALPTEREEFEKDFCPEALEKFRHHYDNAVQAFVVQPIEAQNGMCLRDYNFRQAGIYVSMHSHVLLALWDGQPGKYGCGTAEAVDFALKGSYLPIKNTSLRSDKGEAVLHIFTPRGESTEPAGTVHILGSWAEVEKMLKQTDDFNRRASAITIREHQLLPKDRDADKVLDRMERVYLAASSISTAAAKLYRKILVLLAAVCTLLTTAFLAYDEMQLIWMILVCGLMLLCALALQLWAKRSDCHRLYIDCRALAEALRVQAYLRYAGSGIQAADLLTWSQQEETAWISNALSALSTSDAPDKVNDIRECWVDQQRDYHAKAKNGTKSKLSVNDRVVKTALIISVILYVSAVAFELFCGGLIFTPSIVVPDAEIYRTGLKIVLGGMSALTLFAANFYGRLSLPRQLSDHEKMERFYKKCTLISLSADRPMRLFLSSPAKSL